MSVFDYDAVGANDPLGTASVSVRDILSQTLEGQKPYLYCIYIYKYIYVCE